MNKKYFYLTVLILICNSRLHVFSQTPVSPVNLTPSDTIVCENTTVTLQASAFLPACTNYQISNIPYDPVLPLSAGTTITGFTDDNVRGPFPIGFSFCFYGNEYTQFYVGSNNWVGFSAAQPGTWVTTAIPNNTIVGATQSAPWNCIMSPWQDINPGIGGNVKYQTLGVAPNRKLVVTFNQIPMFSCNTLFYTSQIVIYETTNIIETFIENRQICAAWNSGNAVHGLHNSTGTQATVVPGRNNTAWAATNEGKRFAPNGTGGGPALITWTQIGTPNIPLGTGDFINVSPSQTTQYSATYNNSGTLVGDTVLISIDNQVVSTNVIDITCFGSQNGAISASVADHGPWDYIWSDSNGVPVFAET
ncbi:MAG: hypothetical protein ACOYNH_12670, partial [Bacteroidia bacterium]